MSFNILLSNLNPHRGRILDICRKRTCVRISHIYCLLSFRFIMCKHTLISKMIEYYILQIDLNKLHVYVIANILFCPRVRDYIHPARNMVKKSILISSWACFIVYGFRGMNEAAELFKMKNRGRVYNNEFDAMVSECVKLSCLIQFFL